jgi:hypothetical protein
MKGNFTLAYKVKSIALLLLLVIFVLPTRSAHAQVPAASYGYTAVAGTFTEITGGTAVTVIQTDDNSSAAINLGFTFNYCGVNYNQVIANSNGWLTFGAGTTDLGVMRENTTANLALIKSLLMPLWDDLDGATSAASYIVSGAAPNRVFTFQWKNWEWNWSATGPNLSYQVKLYEGTNIIEFVYRQESAAGSPGGSGGATIGIADGAAVPTFLTLNNSTSTATASSTTFSTGVSSKPTNGQIYRFTPPPNCSTVTGFPTAATTAVSPTSICTSQNVTISITPATAMPAATGITYQWQTSPNVGGPWTDLGAPTTVPTYTTTTPISTPLYYRCVVLCNGTTTVYTSTPSALVTVSNPGTPTITNGTRCGPGTLNLNATVTGAGLSVRWYQNATGGFPISTNNTYTTPYLTANATYYAAAVSNASSQMYNVGMPSFIQTNNFITSSAGWGLRFTVTANCNIDSVAVYPIGTGTISFRIWDALTQAVVYTSPVSGNITGTGIEKVMLPVGAINIPPGNYVFGIASFTGLSNLHNEGFNPIAYPYTSPVLNITAGSQGFGGTGSSAVYYFSYDWRVSTLTGCEGNRVPVTATITPPPAFTKSAPAVLCNNAVGTISVTSPVGNYSNYAWTPVAGLYTNPAGTIPYTGGSATTIYFKSNIVGTQERYMYATNTAAPNCAFADTTRIWVQPDSVKINAAPDTICVSGTTTLSLSPNTGYAPNTIQWQESTNGTAYTNIAGATGVSYTSPVLTANRYYKAIVKAGTNDCQTPGRYIVVANPILNSWADSFNCGPGTVTLQASVGGNANVRWYNSPTASLPVGSGSPFVTPFLGATTDYYVAASTGTPQPPPAFIGVGTLTTTGSSSPYYLGFWADKVQYLITATEMTAQGFTPGFINSIGFDVTTAGGALQNFNIKLKNTTVAALTTVFENNMQDVYSVASFTPTANSVNTHVFQTPFFWDGSNVVIEVCHNNTATGTTSAVKYNTGSAHYHYASAANHCNVQTGTNNFTTTIRPNIRIGMRGSCESPRQLVKAFIYPKPAVSLGQDINECVDEGAVKVLDAGVQPNSPQFHWDDGTSSQVRAVSESGIYNVTVTNSFTCKNSDTIQVTLRDNPVVELGNDTTVCNGVVLNLNAGNDGIEYFWNTGQTTNNININNAGTYIAFVTNGEGCVKIDTIQVEMQGQLPSIQGISVSNNGAYTFQYTAVNPQNVIGYDWDFGDITPHSYQASPTHTYANSGNYIVVLKLSSTCGFFTDSSSAQIVGIHQITVDNNELMVYPNPTTGGATLLSKNLKMEEVSVYNILGQVVLTAKADSPNKHTLELTALASGVYTIQVRTDKGNVARKLEIIK